MSNLFYVHAIPGGAKYFVFEINLLRFYNQINLFIWMLLCIDLVVKKPVFWICNQVMFSYRDYLEY